MLGYPTPNEAELTDRINIPPFVFSKGGIAA
jgi:hypothetical protein